jgi:modulator of FtsH protease HflK
MPWDNKGGWQQGGGGGRGPWGQGPSGGGGNRGGGGGIKPPDLDELMKRGRERLKGWFPNQSPSLVIMALVAGTFLVVWLLTGVYTIQQAEQGVVMRFGKFVTLLEPGIHLRFPQPIETVVRQHVQQRQTNIGFVEDPDNPSAPPQNVPHESLMLSGDGNIVDIDFSVQWRVHNPADFTFNLLDPEETVKAVAESAMREALGQSKFDIAAGEGRGDVEDRVRTIMQTALDNYKSGVSIMRVNVRNVNPPTQVLDAFRDVQAAEQDKIRARNVADRYMNTVVPRARGEAAKILQDAEAYKRRLIAEATGEAQRFLSILEQYKNAKDVTRERMYLETMQKVLGSTNKVILQSEGRGSPIVPYLPLPELRRSQPVTSTPSTTGGGQ